MTNGSARDSVPVTCVIASCNNIDTLRGAILSVLNQSVPVREIIVCDDASTDGSQDLISEIAASVNSIRPIFRTQNIGVSANRDLAIRESKQPFVTQLDGDDLFARRKVEFEWAALSGRADSVAYSYVAHLHPNRFWRSSVQNPAETVEDSMASPLELLLSRRGSIPRDMLLAKSLYLETGGYHHEARLYEDWELKLRLAAMNVDWRHSGHLGTLYVQRISSLSRANWNAHLEQLLEIMQRLDAVIRPILGEQKMRSAHNRLCALKPAFQASRERGLEATTLEPEVSAEFANNTPSLSRLFRSLRARIRFLRYYPKLWPLLRLNVHGQPE